MPKFKLTAESIGYLEITITAKNEDEAWNKIDDLIDSGEMEEKGVGSIENKNVEEIK